jgi:lipid-binding SYLF domain-containing protein
MFAALTVASFLADTSTVAAATASQIRSEAEAALTRLYNQNTVAVELSRKAKGILVFPEITKAGVGIGGSYGEGVLFVDGSPAGYYSVGSGSLGLTLGAQSFSQVIMFMTPEALNSFRTSKGWEAGVDGSVVAIDEGQATSYDTTKAADPVVGFTFGQQGLMFDASFKGAKYTRIKR